MNYYIYIFFFSMSFLHLFNLQMYLKVTAQHNSVLGNEGYLIPFHVHFIHYDIELRIG